MPRPAAALAPAALAVPAAFVSLSAAAFGGESGGEPGGVAAPRAFLERHCADCHGEWLAEGGFRVDELPGDPTGRSAAPLWARVHDRLAAGEMPPPEDAAVPPAERDAAVAALSAWLTAADDAARTGRGRSAVRRLNAAEYEAALRDLLGLPHLEVAAMLPPDGEADGFAKSADALDLSPALLERLLDAADKALAEAAGEVGVAPPEPVVKRAVVADHDAGMGDFKRDLNGLYIFLKQTNAVPLIGPDAHHLRVDPTLERSVGNFAKRDPGFVRDPAPHFDGVGVSVWHSEAQWLKALKTGPAGVYKIRVNGFAFRNDRGAPRPTDRPAAVSFDTAHGFLGTVTLPPNEPATAELECRVGANLNPRFSVSSSPVWRLEGKADPPRYTRFDLPGVVFKWFEIEGPLVEEWPPPSHAALFGDLPAEPLTAEQRKVREPDDPEYAVNPADPDAAARRLLTRFATRAFRRPANDADLAVPLAVYEDHAAAGSAFAPALLAAYRAVLCSPDFLLVRGETADPGRGGALTPHALAERLSLFLWNSVPDDALLDAAADGSLADPAVLAAHADRLLDDPRSRRFADHFLDHWLDLGDFDLTVPDENLYPEWRPLLARSAAEEPRLAFARMLAEDRPAFEAVDSDDLVLNQTLAELYGVPGVDGFDFRAVPVPADGPGAARGGLLTTAAALKVTANGTTTSPVTRGVFVQDRLLGDPPPPPPDAVPAVEPDISGATTIREQLAAHRADPACAACHANIDPPGFALESFDVIGRLRDRYRSLGEGDKVEGVDRRSHELKYRLGLPVDPSGELAGGRAFADLSGLRDLLRTDERRVARNLLRRLASYATGSPVRFGDRAEVERILDAAEPSGYGVRTLIHELLRSRLFREK